MKNENAFRPKYSKAIVDRICKFIESGLNNKQACQAAGISETSLLVWRKQHPEFAERVEAAREFMRAQVLAKIREAGKDDWRALECFLRLSFSEYRLPANQVSVAVQTNVDVSDPERARLIDELEKARARVLADKPLAPQLEDKTEASDAREVALEAERRLQEPAAPVAEPEPARLRERPPKTVVERERDEWREAQRRQAARDEVDEILDF
jgi:hypothetical protein